MQEEIRGMIAARIKADEDKMTDLREKAQEDIDLYGLEAKFDIVLELLIEEEVETLVENVAGEINF